MMQVVSHEKPRGGQRDEGPRERRKQEWRRGTNFECGMKNKKEGRRLGSENRSY